MISIGNCGHRSVWDIGDGSTVRICQLACVTHAVCMQVWPTLGLHHASVAKIASLLEQDVTALKASQAAADILQYTHPESPVLQEQWQLLYNLQREKDSRSDALELQDV